MKDVAGRKLDLGDVVLYPVPAGRSTATMKIIIFDGESGDGFSAYVLEQPNHYITNFRKTTFKKRQKCFRLDDLSIFDDEVVDIVNQKLNELFGFQIEDNLEKRVNRIQKNKHA